MTGTGRGGAPWGPRTLGAVSHLPTQDPPETRRPVFQRRPCPGVRAHFAGPGLPWDVRPTARLGRSRLESKARKAHGAAAGSRRPPRPTPHPRRGVCPTCASCASCPCPTGPRCPPPAPGPGRAAPLPVRARRAEGGSGARETPRREAGGRRAPDGARPFTRSPRARPGRSPRAAAGRRAAGAAAGERVRRARRVGPSAHGGPWRLEVALLPAGRGRSPGRGRGRGRGRGGVHCSESLLPSSASSLLRLPSSSRLFLPFLPPSSF